MFRLLMVIVLVLMLMSATTNYSFAQEEVIESAVVKNDLKKVFAEIERQAQARVDRAMIPADWTEKDIEQYIRFLRFLGIELRDPDELRGKKIPLNKELNQGMKFRSYLLPALVGTYYLLNLNQQQINITITINKTF
jgi:hypothetical protein